MILLSSSLNSFIQLVGVLLIFCFVLAMTYFVSKWIGGYQKGSMLNKNLRVVESIKIGTNKFICLVKAGEIYLVVAVGKDEVTMLAQLTEEQLSEDSVSDTGNSPLSAGSLKATENFQEILEKIKGRFPKK